MPTNLPNVPGGLPDWLLSQPPYVPDRTVGAILSSLDVSGSLISCQVWAPYTVGGMIWGVTKWGAGTWQSATGGRPVDVTDLLQGLSWTRGASSPGGKPETGTANVRLRNLDGAASPWATAGAFVAANRSWLRAGAYVRFGVNHLAFSQQDTPHPGYKAFFTGRIESIAESTDSAADAWVTLNLVETVADWAAYQVPVFPFGLGFGDNLPDRVAHLLALMNNGSGWPGQYNSWSSSGTDQMTADAEIQARLSVSGSPFIPTLQHTTLTTNFWQELQLAADSTGQVIFADQSGAVGSRSTASVSHIDDSLLDFHLKVGNTWYTTFTNGAPGSRELPIPVDGVTPYSSTDRLLNSVTAQRVGGVAQTYKDLASIQYYQSEFTTGLNSGFPRTDLTSSDDTTVAIIAKRASAAHAWDENGISAIQLDADMHPGLWLQMVMLAYSGIERRQGFGIRWVHPSGNTFTEAVLLDGFTMGITMEGSQAKWTASLLTSAENPSAP